MKRGDYIISFSHGFKEMHGIKERGIVISAENGEIEYCSETGKHYRTLESYVVPSFYREKSAI